MYQKLPNRKYYYILHKNIDLTADDPARTITLLLGLLEDPLEDDAEDEDDCIVYSDELMSPIILDGKRLLSDGKERPVELLEL